MTNRISGAMIGFFLGMLAWMLLLLLYTVIMGATGNDVFIYLSPQILCIILLSFMFLGTLLGGIVGVDD